MAKKSRFANRARARAPARRKSAGRGFAPRARSGSSRGSGQRGAQRFVVQHIMSQPQTAAAPFMGGALGHYLQALLAQNLPSGGVAIPGALGVPAAEGPVKQPKKKAKL